MEDFKVRPVKTEEELESVVKNFMVKEDWRPGLKDTECYLACDPSGAFLGEFNEKPIAFILMTKYGDRFAFVGCCIVNKEYRERDMVVKLLST